jgi:hypothetical protein
LFGARFYLSDSLHTGRTFRRRIVTIDHIVEEVRKVREAQAARMNYDIKKIIAEAQKKQKQSNHQIVSYAKSEKAIT